MVDYRRNAGKNKEKSCWKVVVVLVVFKVPRPVRSHGTGGFRPLTTLKLIFSQSIETLSIDLIHVSWEIAGAILQLNRFKSSQEPRKSVHASRYYSRYWTSSRWPDDCELLLFRLIFLIKSIVYLPRRWKVIFIYDCPNWPSFVPLCEHAALNWCSRWV